MQNRLVISPISSPASARCRHPFDNAFTVHRYLLPFICEHIRFLEADLCTIQGTAIRSLHRHCHRPLAILSGAYIKKPMGGVDLDNDLCTVLCRSLVFSYVPSSPTIVSLIVNLPSFYFPISFSYVYTQHSICERV